MSKPTVPELAHAYCVEKGYEWFMFGDVGILDGIVFDALPKTSKLRDQHPMVRHSHLLDALQRRPDLFKKGYVRMGRGTARSFDVLTAQEATDAD